MKNPLTALKNYLLEYNLGLMTKQLFDEVDAMPDGSYKQREPWPQPKRDMFWNMVSYKERGWW